MRKKNVIRKMTAFLFAAAMCVSLCTRLTANAQEGGDGTSQQTESKEWSRQTRQGKEAEQAEGSLPKGDAKKETDTQEASKADSAHAGAADTTADITGKDDGGISEASEKEQGQQEKNAKAQEQTEQPDAVAVAQELEPLSASALNNPRIEKDSSMKAGQKVTWDCVWFGSYPQAEVVPSADSYTAVDKSLLKSGDIIENSRLYSKLQNATGWNSNNDITVGGNKYRRMKKSDATYTSSGSDYYNWSDSDTWHYFKYEPIKWRVLKVDGNQAFLLSDIALDDQKYNTVSESITWETSTIRSWLNGYGASSNKQGNDYSSKSFIGSAFSSNERSAIVNTSVGNDDNINYGTEGGNNTTDKIFLLSESETYGDSAVPHGFVSSSGTYDEARRSKSSTYARAMGTWSGTSDVYKGNCWWWLRSPGESTKYAAYVFGYGYVNDRGRSVFPSNDGVRAALNLNLSSNLYTYAGTVSSDGKENEVGGGSDSTGGDKYLAETDYETDVVSFMKNKGTLNTIKYLCKDSNFTNSIYVHENDMTFGSKITLILSDVYYRGLDGWKDLFTSATSKADAEKILATLLQEYQSDVEQLAMAKNAKKYAGYFVKGLKDYIKAEGIASSLNNKDIENLSNIITEQKVSELLVEGDYKKLSAYFQVEGGYSENSEIVKALNNYMSSNTLANTLSKGLDFLGDGLTILSLTQDTFNYLYQLESLSDADEMYSEMLLYLKDNCCFDVVKDAAADLYNVIHGSYVKQLGYVSAALKDAVVDQAVDMVISKAVDALPYGKIIKAGFDWGVNISNAIFHTGDTQQLKDSMRTIAYIGNCLSLWVLENQTSFYTSADSDKNMYARKLYYSMYMLWNTRKAGEQTLQSMCTKAYKKWSKYYTLSLQISSTLDSYKDSIFTDSMTKAFISVTVSCPVDVEVYNGDGKLIAIAKDGEESSGYTEDVYYYVRYQKLDEDYVKILCFPEDSGYTLKYKGKDIGAVDSVILNITEEGDAERKYIENIKVKNDTVITVDSLSSDMPSYTVVNGFENESPKGTFQTEPDKYTPVTGIKLTESKLQLKVGEKRLIAASALPENATEKKVLWSSSDEAVAEVNSEGVITAKAAGQCIVQCTAVGSSDIHKTVDIVVLTDQAETPGGGTEVPGDETESPGNGTGGSDSGSNTGIQAGDRKNIKVSAITLSGISKKIAAGKKIKLTANIAPANASNKSITWTSSNKKVAAVNSKGVVTMKKKSGGKSVTITATAKDGSGVKATYKIKSMKGVVKKVTISGKKSMKAGKTLKLKAKVTATKGANKKLKWTSSNTKYATVSSSGKVKARKAGKGKKVKITVTATDGSGKKKAVTIKIN